MNEIEQGPVIRKYRVVPEARDLPNNEELNEERFFFRKKAIKYLLKKEIQEGVSFSLEKHHKKGGWPEGWEPEIFWEEEIN